MISVRNLIKNMGIVEKLSLIFLVIIVLVSIFGRFISPHRPDQIHLLSKHLPPAIFGGDPQYLLGTDELGRDILSRLLQATRISMTMAFVGMFFGSAVGIILGLTAGYFEGWWDRVVLTLINIQQSIPYEFFVLVMIVILGRGDLVILLAVGLSGWNSYARYVRGLVKSIKQEQFIDAAKSYGASPGRILAKYVLPNCLSLIIVLMTLNFPNVLLLESSLSFLGIGVQPPTATLGQMVGGGRNFMMTNMWLVFLPSLVIVLISASVMRLGEYLQVQVSKNDHYIGEIDNE